VPPIRPTRRYLGAVACFVVPAVVWGGCGGGASPPQKAEIDLDYATADQALDELDRAEGSLVAFLGPDDARNQSDPNEPKPAEPDRDGPSGPSPPPPSPGETKVTTMSEDSGSGDRARSPCETACEALGSMRRAAKRVCALEPGERCSKAQTRVSRASERVRSRCQECEE
jgi:hypothetical protein